MVITNPSAPSIRLPKKRADDGFNGDASEVGAVSVCLDGVLDKAANENREEPLRTERLELRRSARDTWAAIRSMIHIITIGRPMRCSWFLSAIMLYASGDSGRHNAVKIIRILRALADFSHDSVVLLTKTAQYSFTRPDDEVTAVTGS
jgi:hypothetical protein